MISAVSASAVVDKLTFTILQNGENPSSGFGFGQIPESPADPFGDIKNSSAKPPLPIVTAGAFLTAGSSSFLVKTTVPRQKTVLTGRIF